MHSQRYGRLSGETTFNDVEQEDPRRGIPNSLQTGRACDQPEGQGHPPTKDTKDERLCGRCV